MAEMATAHLYVGGARFDDCCGEFGLGCRLSTILDSYGEDEKHRDGVVGLSGSIARSSPYHDGILLLM